MAKKFGTWVKKKYIDATRPMDWPDLSRLSQGQRDQYYLERTMNSSMMPVLAIPPWPSPEPPEDPEPIARKRSDDFWDTLEYD
jgi:hypothetical protein